MKKELTKEIENFVIQLTNHLFDNSSVHPEKWSDIFTLIYSKYFDLDSVSNYVLWDRKRKMLESLRRL